jgi:hypothetical protein
MGSKSKKQAISKNNSMVRKHRINKKDSEDARRRVSQRAPTSNKQCLMRIQVYLNNNNRLHLSPNSCLDHKHHPKLDDQAISLSHKDMSKQELKFLDVLYDMNVPPSKITTILILSEMTIGELFYQRLYSTSMKNAGILLSKQDGTLPTCSDAEKL